MLDLIFKVPKLSGARVPEGNVLPFSLPKYYVNPHRTCSAFILTGTPGEELGGQKEHGLVGGDAVLGACLTLRAIPSKPTITKAGYIPALATSCFFHQVYYLWLCNLSVLLLLMASF